MAFKPNQLATVVGQDPLSTRSESAKIKDTDLTHDSPHHTIGYGATQAAPGNVVQRLEARVKALEAVARAQGWDV